MSLFCSFFSEGRGGRGLVVFAVFLRGVLGKGVFLVWCFAGEFVRLSWTEDAVLRGV
jgi:hypothetical protein